MKFRWLSQLVVEGGVEKRVENGERGAFLQKKISKKNRQDKGIADRTHRNRAKAAGTARGDGIRFRIFARIWIKKMGPI